MIYSPTPAPSEPVPATDAPFAQAETSAMLEARQRHQQHRAFAMTPRERLAAMDAIIRSSWEVLRANPAALAHFQRRNHRKRAIPAARDIADLENLPMAD